MGIPLRKLRPQYHTIHSWLASQEQDLTILSTEQQLYLEQQLHLLLLHGLSAAQYKAHLQRMLDKDQQFLLASLVNLRVRLIEDPDLNTWYKPTFLRYLETQDPIYFRYLRRHSGRVDRMLREHPIRYTPQIMIVDYGPLHQQALFEEMRGELEKYIHGFVNSRMSFIFKSNRMQPRDLVYDLICRLLVIYRWQYPFRNREHLLKSCKASVRNAGVNMIHYWTSQGRARLLHNDKEGYSNRAVALSEMMEHKLQNSNWEEQALGWDNEGIVSCPDKMVQDLALQQFRERIDTRTRVALDLILNPKPPVEFLNFAEQLYHTRITDLESFQRTLFVRELKLKLPPFSLFLRLVRKYCGLEKWEMELLLAKLKYRVFI